MTTHPEQAAILRAVLEDPDDDLARMAFADWCEENGDPLRAEFVRLHLRLARLPDYSNGHYGHGPHGRREAGLREQLEARGWHAPLQKNRDRWAYRRGLLCSVEMNLYDFVPAAQELFSRHPVVEVRLLGPLRSGFPENWGSQGWREAFRRDNFAGKPPGARARQKLLRAVKKAMAFVEAKGGLGPKLTSLVLVGWGRSLAELPPLPGGRALQSEPDKDGDAAAGLVCPRCGCADLRTTNTLRLDRYVRRYKRCRHCGRRVTTVERRVGDAAKEGESS